MGEFQPNYVLKEGREIGRGCERGEGAHSKSPTEGCDV